MNWLYLALAIIILWAAALSAGYYFLFVKINALTKGVGKENLLKILDKVLQKEAANEKQISETLKQFAILKKEQVGHIQKIGLIRFNPFDEIGGDHSFCLSMLDGSDTGFVLTCLHTREKTRVYTKPVKQGKSQYELSEEEKKALNQAYKVTKA